MLISNYSLFLSPPRFPLAVDLIIAKITVHLCFNMMQQVGRQKGEAIAVITGITEGCAEGARGHMDCLEII